MSYRDDREALREQARALEQELEVTRAELERLKSGELTEARKEPESPSLSLWLVTLLTLVAVVLILPLPPGFRLMIGTLSASLIAIAIVLGSTVVIARPSEALVLSGRERRRGDRTVGYRLVRGGRAVRLPLLESAARLDLGAFRVPVSLRGVHTSDRAIDAALVVHARLHAEEPEIDHAVSRMLGVEPEKRREICATLLDPVLRDGIAQCDFDELERGHLGSVTDKLTRYSADHLSKSGIDLLAIHVLGWRETQP